MIWENRAQYLKTGLFQKRKKVFYEEILYQADSLWLKAPILDIGGF